MFGNKKLAIGAIACVIVAAVSVAGFAVTGKTDAATAESGYCALMSDAVGLYEGNPVTQMGYKVGQVERIQPKGDHVEVTFTLDAGRQYPADVKAVTRSKSLLADRSLELVGNYDGGAELSSGNCIAMAHTATPKSISEITGSLADFLESVEPSAGKDSVADAIAGLDEALRGNGDGAQSLLRHSSDALSTPDATIADIRSIIVNLAPLTTDALAKWSTVREVFDTLPTVLTSASDRLWPGGTNLIKGIGPLVATIYDIQANYGGDIWPAADGLADVLRVAATRSDDIQSLLSTLPSMSGAVRQVSAGDGGFSVQYRPPTVQVSTPDGPQWCELLNQALAHSCSIVDNNVRMVDVRLLDLVLAKGK
jgi:virulence factor Mce-like protein